MNADLALHLPIQAVKHVESLPSSSSTLPLMQQCFCLSLWEAYAPAVEVFCSSCTVRSSSVSLLHLSLPLSMAVQLVVALLALASMSAASAPDCKELVKPLVLEDHTEVSCDHSTKHDL